MRIFGLAGWSGSGKTTLMTALIPEFVARGITVSTVKHAHHAFDVDQPGKDSWRHRQAGAYEVMVRLAASLGADARVARRAGARARRAGGADTPGRSAAGRRVQASPAPEDRGLSPGRSGSRHCIPTTAWVAAVASDESCRGCRCRCCRSAIRRRSPISSSGMTGVRDGPAERRLLCFWRRADERRRGAGADRRARRAGGRCRDGAVAAGRRPHLGARPGRGDGLAAARQQRGRRLRGGPCRSVARPRNRAAGRRPGRRRPSARPPAAARRGDPHLHRRADARGRRHRADAGGLRRRPTGGCGSSPGSERGRTAAMPARMSAAGADRARRRAPARPGRARPRRGARLSPSCRCSAACAWPCCRPATRCASRAPSCRRARSTTPTALS